MTPYCQGCINIAKFRENREMYEHLKKDHECTLNHEGSAGQMEVIGVERIFSRSIETHKLCYTEFYEDGDYDEDGDSKSFSSVEHIYSPKVVKKEMYRTQHKNGLVYGSENLKKLNWALTIN